MSTRTRIEFWTGEKLGYETADELGLEAFQKRVRERKVTDYLEYSRRKRRKREDFQHIRRLARLTGNRELGFRASQSRNCRRRNKFWRSLGYPNLRKAWQKRRENCARRRAEKAVEEERERMRKQLEQYGYIRP